MDRFHLIISLYFVLPKTDKETLEKLSIPSYVPPSADDSSPQNHATNQVITNGLVNGHATGSKTTDSSVDVVDAVMNAPPIIQYSANKPSNISCGQEPESNSEDSSLSDGDRTLVGDVSPIDSVTSSPAHLDQQWPSPDEPKTNGFDGDDDTDMTDDTKARDLYFKAVYYEEPSTAESGEPARLLKVLVHKNIIIANLKHALAPYIKVPMEYFKIFRSSSTQNETECTRLSERISIFK